MLLKEIKQFLKQLLKSSYANENCEVSIAEGAHGTIGKLITKICKKERRTKRNKSFQRHHYESVSVQENDFDEDDEQEYQESPFERPFKREYILRSSVARPATYSRQSPQRMYCLLTNSEFRLAGAFTEDTMFF